MKRQTRAIIYDCKNALKDYITTQDDAPYLKNIVWRMGLIQWGQSFSFYIEEHLHKPINDYELEGIFN